MMADWNILVFATALGIAAFSPGPSLAAVVAMVLSSGARRAAWFCVGVIIGDLTWLLLSLSGLALVTQQFPMIFVFIKWAGVFYLAYIAINIWRAPPMATNTQLLIQKGNISHGVMSGFSVTMGNPKAMLFYLALLPTLITVEHLSILTIAALCLIVITVLATVFTFYITAASKAGQMLTRRQSVQTFNRVTAATLISAAVWIATK